jgi:UDP-N-acetylmuramate: L-alanyl-gamma-D-glutamyl-meso-diaminopimelate ligase
MKIHLVAICGTGMGSLAGLLKEAGHDVQGSDKAFYPPMSKALKDWGIPTMEGFDPAHLDNLDPKSDLVVVGNACRKDNPEALAAKERGFKVMSFPQALYQSFIADKQSIVIAGTHGKTSTTALLSYLLVEAEKDPGFLVGGITQNYSKSFRFGKGEFFIVEGDEYDSAYFDKRPKFLHYRPKIAILTSIEFDHADIFKSMDHYRAAFSAFVRQMPEDGLLVANWDDSEVRSLASQAACCVLWYGYSNNASYRAQDIITQGKTTTFTLKRECEADVSISIPLNGRHNVANTLAVLAVAGELGISPQEASRIFTSYGGVARRMQVRGQVGGITVIDDFAHHPTAVKETILGARERYQDSHLIAVFEPRTNTSRRKFFQGQYAKVFGAADRVVVVPPYNAEQIEEDQRFDSKKLVEDLVGQGQDAILLNSVEQVIDNLVAKTKENSVILIMSNGAFGDIHIKLLDRLRKNK